MSPLHICNTFFERELETPNPKNLIDWLQSHPVVLQLQFLPLVYAGPEEAILVSHLPSTPDPRLIPMNNCPHFERIEEWAPSRAIASWARARSLAYAHPDWEVIRTINSKIFSFTESPKLPEAALLTNEREVAQWLEKTQGPKVLKTAFGTAGNGHFHIDQHKPLHSFLNRQFSQRLPVIGEPWVERILDFSTQWVNGNFLAATVFENDAQGTYQSTLSGKAEVIFRPHLWALEEHLPIAQSFVQKLKDKGYSGPIGIDAYIYRIQGQERLHPVVEINARKTMSWVAFEVQRRRFPDRTVRLAYGPAGPGLLPMELELPGKTVRFSRQLSIHQIN